MFVRRSRSFLRWTAAASLCAAGCGDSGGAGVGADGQSEGRPDSSYPDATQGSQDGESGEVGEAESSGTGADPCEPEALARIDTLATDHAISDLVATSTHVYACGEALGLVALPYDADGFGELSIEDPLGCKRIAISADLGSLAASSPSRGDVSLYEISSDGSLDFLDSTSAVAQPEGLDLGDQRLWVAGREAGVFEFELSSGLPLLNSAVQSGDDARDVKAVGTTLMVASGASGVRRQSQQNLAVLTQRELVGVAYDIARLPAQPGGADSWAIATMDGAAVLEDDAALTIRSEATSYGVGLGVLGLETRSGPRLLIADWTGLRQRSVEDVEAATLSVSTLGGTSPGLRAVASGRADDVDYVFSAGVFGVTQQAGSAFGCDAPAISSQLRELIFAPTPAGNTLAKVLQIRNEGTQRLTVSAISASHPQVTVTPANLELEPGQIGALQVVFEPSDAAVLEGGLRISTNDPDDPEFTIPYVANRPGLTVGDPAPKLSMIDLEGDHWSNTMLMGKVSLLAYFATW